MTTVTRFSEFDDDDHPFNVWWKQHGQYMLSGGGRRESIWAARGWIAREQMACGVEVTGESMHETPTPGVSGTMQKHKELSSCSKCGKEIFFHGDSWYHSFPADVFICGKAVAPPAQRGQTAGPFCSCEAGSDGDCAIHGPVCAPRVEGQQVSDTNRSLFPQASDKAKTDIYREMSSLKKRRCRNESRSW